MSEEPAWSPPGSASDKPSEPEPATLTPAAPAPAYPVPGYPAYPAYPPPYDSSGHPPPYNPTYPPPYDPSGYGGYGAAGPAYPAYPVGRRTNPMAIASMTTSIVALPLLTCYGLGLVVGVVGAVLGHISKRQIRERGEAGDGMALAGIIMGWIGAALGLLGVAGLVVLIVALARSAPAATTY
jgi:hypothetical protein